MEEECIVDRVACTFIQILVDLVDLRGQHSNKGDVGSNNNDSNHVKTKHLPALQVLSNFCHFC